MSNKKRALVVYKSKYGSTDGIAKTITKTLRGTGVTVMVSSDPDTAPSPKNFDVVVLGSAVYSSQWRQAMHAYCLAHYDDLVDNANVWLFSTGPVGKYDQLSTEYPDTVEMLMREGSPVRDHAVFKGALDSKKLNVFERAVTKIVRAEDGDYRNWENIKAWAQRIAGSVGE